MLAKIAKLGTLNQWILKKMDTMIWTRTVFGCSVFVPNWTIDGVYQAVFSSQLRDLTVFNLYNSINYSKHWRSCGVLLSEDCLPRPPFVCQDAGYRGISREYMEASCTHENVISRAEAKLQSQSWLTAHLANNLNMLK